MYWGTGTQGQGVVSTGTSTLPIMGDAAYYSVAPFIVGADTHSQYATIQEGIDAASAQWIATGKPGNVYVKPGTYTENLTVINPMNIIGLGSSDQNGTMPSQVIIGGQMTCAAATCTFQNIKFMSPGSTASVVTYGSGASSILSFNNCQFIGTGGSDKIFNSTVEGGTLNLTNCYAETSGGLFINIANSMILDVNINNCSLVMLMSIGGDVDFNISNSRVQFSPTYTPDGEGSIDIENCYGDITIDLALSASAVPITISYFEGTCGGISVASSSVTCDFSRLTSSGASILTDSGAGGNTHSFRESILSSPAAVASINNSILTFSGGSISGGLPTASGAGDIIYKNILIIGGGMVTNSDTIANNSNDGFLYIPAKGDGIAPTGSPETYGQSVALIFDKGNNKLYIYNGGLWKSVTLT